MSNQITVSGGQELHRLASLPADMSLEIGDIRYCIHFMALKGGYPNYLQDPNLMRMAQEQTTKLVLRRYGSR